MQIESPSLKLAATNPWFGLTVKYYDEITTIKRREHEKEFLRVEEGGTRTGSVVDPKISSTFPTSAFSFVYTIVLNLGTLSPTVSL